MTAVLSQMRAGRQPPPSLSSRIIRSAYLRALASSGNRGPPCRRAPYNIEAHRISLAATLVPVDCMYWFLSNPLGLLSSSLFSVADLLFALRFFGAHNPRRSNLHQYSLILFRRSVRQPFTFCRVLAEAVGVIVHDTSVVSKVPKCQPGTPSTVPVQISLGHGTKSTFTRLARTHFGGGVTGE